MAPSATSKAEAVTTTTTQAQTTATTAATADDGPAVDQLPPSPASFKTAYESGGVEMVKGSSPTTGSRRQPSLDARAGLDKPSDG